MEEPERIRLTPAEERARRNRSIAIGIVLVALVVIFYLVSLAKMAS
ncbi:protoheme IX farnesyltransferase [Jiella mangrovi]